ncbi:MAG: phage holin family protein [Bacteroidota bacterium]|nr:phage holin family protein [Bacteroidota bacterium]
MKFILRLLITAAVAYGLSMILEPHVHIDSFSTALIFVLVLSILNVLVKPILIILTLPITILTLGIFLLIINVLMILLAGEFVSGIQVHGFLWAFIFGLLLSFLSSAIIANMRKAKK